MRPLDAYSGGVSEFFRGAGMLVRGFRWWAQRPAVMALGLVPAAVVWGLLFVGLVVLSINLPDITDAVTPFADGWPGLWATVLRVAVGTAMLGAALVVGAVTSTTLTLAVGEPIFDRIWRMVEFETTGTVPAAGHGFWRSTADAFALLARAAGLALGAAAVGLIPVIGSVLGAAVGIIATGWLLADELTSRALSARGIPRSGREELRRGHRARTLGFGIATQVFFMIPFGAVLTMPAAVAGSTLLAQSLADAEETPGALSDSSDDHAAPHITR